MSGEIIVIAEKPELARAIAEGLGGGARQDGFIDCGRHYVTWAIGHMLELVDPQDPWNMAALPISFIPWEKRPVAKTSAQLCTIGKLLKSARSVIHAGDPDDEGQLIVDEILQWVERSLLGFRLPSYRVALPQYSPRLLQGLRAVQYTSQVAQTD